MDRPQAESSLNSKAQLHTGLEQEARHKASAVSARLKMKAQAWGVAQSCVARRRISFKAACRP